MKPDVAKLRQTILQLAVEGRLVPQDSSDEPADKLLQRIAAEKLASINSRGSKSLPDFEQDETPFDLPASWKWARLGDVSIAINDGTHKTPKYMENGVKFLSIRNITKGYIDLENVKYISRNEHEELIKRCRPERGDILFCRIGTLGQSKVIDVDEEFSIFVSLGLIKLPSLMDEYYLEKVLNSPYMYEVFKKVRVGGLHTNKLNLRDMPLLPIALPPLAEQKRIVAKVDELMMLCDKLEDKSNNLLKTLSKLRQSVLQLAIEGKLTTQDLDEETVDNLLERISTKKEFPAINEAEMLLDIPANWEWIRIGQVATVKGGKRVPKGQKLTSSPTNHTYIRVTDMTNGTVNQSNLQYIDDDTFEKISRYTISSDDVYITIAGTIGRVGTVPVELDGSNLTENAAKLVFKELNKKYLTLALSSDHIQSQFSQRTIQAAQPKLALKRIELTTLPLPPLPEQKRIVEKVEALMNLCDAIQTKLIHEIIIQE